MSKSVLDTNEYQSVNLQHCPINLSKQLRKPSKSNTLHLRKGPTILANKFPKNFFKSQLPENIQQTPQKHKQNEQKHLMANHLSSQRKITSQNLILESGQQDQVEEGQITSFFGFKQFIGNQSSSQIEQKQQNSHNFLDKAGFQYSEDNRTEATRKNKNSSKPSSSILINRDSCVSTSIPSEDQGYLKFDHSKREQRENFLQWTFALNIPIDTTSHLIKPTYQPKSIQRGSSLSSQRQSKNKILPDFANPRTQSNSKRSNKKPYQKKRNLQNIFGQKNQRKYESQHEVDFETKFALPPISKKHKERIY